MWKQIFIVQNAVLLAAMLCAGCSSVRTQKPSLSLATIQSSERLQLLVRTGETVMDELLYELAYFQFDDVLPFSEKEPYTGVVEITFASSDQDGFVGSSHTSGSAQANSSGWYSQSGYVGGTTTVTGSSSTVSSGVTLTWQNSTMLMVVKKNDGERIWTAGHVH